jgi:molecular chaperone DnaJ
MARDLYLVLGISRDADLQQVKSAYRRLIKLYHPDYCQQPTDKFLEVKEAYDVLSNQKLRSQHDKNLQTRKPTSKVEIESETLVRPKYQAPAMMDLGCPIRPGNEQSRFFAELDEFFEGWVPGFFTQGRGASRHKDMYVELVLSPAEAELGGIIPLKVPVERTCISCNGTGFLGLLSCEVCRGSGHVVEYDEIKISIPSGVTEGITVKLSLDDIGLPGIDLNVLVTVRT